MQNGVEKLLRALGPTLLNTFWDELECDLYSRLPHQMLGRFLQLRLKIKWWLLLVEWRFLTATGRPSLERSLVVRCPQTFGQAVHVYWNSRELCRVCMYIYSPTHSLPVTSRSIDARSWSLFTLLPNSKQRRGQNNPMMWAVLRFAVAE